MSYAVRFGRFLYDFLVGDAWELFVGPIVGLFVAWLLFQAGIGDAAVGVALFVAVLAVITVHLAVALRGAA